MSSKTKNLISLFAFILFIAIGCIIFVHRYRLKVRANEIVAMYKDSKSIDDANANEDNNSDEVANQNMLDSSSELDAYIEAKLLKNSYDDFGFLDVSSSSNVLTALSFESSVTWT